MAQDGRREYAMDPQMEDEPKVEQEDKTVWNERRWTEGGVGWGGSLRRENKPGWNKASEQNVTRMILGEERLT